MERMNLCRLEMAKAAKKTDKVKKPSQTEGGGRVEDSTVADTPNERMVILTDGNDPDTQHLDGNNPDTAICHILYIKRSGLEIRE